MVSFRDISEFTDIMLTDARTGSTTKAAAFASPKWTYETEAYIAGDNSLTPEEQSLIEAYETQGRPDLAECVGGGRRYQRLDHLLFIWVPTYGEERALGQLTGMRRAFLGEEITVPTSLKDWIEWAKEVQKGDPELEAVIKLDESCRLLRDRRPENLACEGAVFNCVDLRDFK
jgi:hypothetical protein